MLYMLDTGRMAYKLEKWRGALYVVATAVPLAIANFISQVFGILPAQPQPLDAFQWIEIGCYAVAFLLLGYGSYSLYRDHVHHDYYLEADRYQCEGW